MSPVSYTGEFYGGVGKGRGGKVSFQVQNYEYSVPGHLVGFEVFTAVVTKSTIFWDITTCSPLSVSRRFGGTYRLHLQSRKNKFSKKPACKQVAIFRETSCIDRRRY
jgi:hypothetical protein